MTGTTVGHYEILEKLGEGGMGMVFRARDLLLNRLAALKFLPAGSSVTEEKRRRFMQEAQAASALNHPNIVTIYEIGRSGDHDFIAMELIRGRTLGAIAGRKGSALPEALTCAIQIADALAAAHCAGIVHRDLKPGNIMITETGLVKVLDFGLAKLTRAPETGDSEATRTIGAESVKTVEGAIVGTVSYMSPEQAEGKPVDYRSDIFSFGAVLYEMLTGRRAFQGESTVSTLAAILTSEPPQLSRDELVLPRELDRIVHHCLRKAPEKRWQSMADIKIGLEDLRDELHSGRPSTPAAPVRSRRWIPFAATGLLAATLAALVVWKMRPVAQVPERWRIHRLTADTGANVSPAISPDGKLVAYASDRSGEGPIDIWVQQVAGGDPVRLTRGLGHCYDPAFSPDSSKLVFRCDAEGGGVYVVSTLGGTPRKLADGQEPRFSPDGTQISYIPSAAGNSDSNSSIMIMPAGGGVPRELRTKERVIGRTLWTPDGKGLVFLGVDTSGKNAPDWYRLSADGHKQAATGAVARLRKAELGTVVPQGWIGGDILFFAGGATDSSNVYRLPFDSQSGQVSGDPVPITTGAGFNFNPTASSDARKVAFASGTNVSSNLWRISIDPSSGKTAGEPSRITEGLEARYSPFPSQDAKRIVYVLPGSNTSEIRMRNLDPGTELRLAEAQPGSSPVLSKDGTQVAYFLGENGKSALYTVPARGGVPRKLCDDCGRPIEWTPDGSKLLYDRAGPQRGDIAIFDLNSRRSQTLVHDLQHRLYTPRISPDGLLLCFTAMLGARARRIYVAPFSGDRQIDQKSWTVAVDGSDLERQPFWSPSGYLIVFLSERDGYRCVWAQRVDPRTRRPSGDPVPVRHFHQARYNLSDISDPAWVGLSIANGQMFFAMFEVQSNIWLAER